MRWRMNPVHFDRRDAAVIRPHRTAATFHSGRFARVPARDRPDSARPGFELLPAPTGRSASVDAWLGNCRRLGSRLIGRLLCRARRPPHRSGVASVGHSPACRPRPASIDAWLGSCWRLVRVRACQRPKRDQTPPHRSGVASLGDSTVCQLATGQIVRAPVASRCQLQRADRQLLVPGLGTACGLVCV